MDPAREEDVGQEERGGRRRQVLCAFHPHSGYFPSDNELVAHGRFKIVVVGDVGVCKHSLVRPFAVDGQDVPTEASSPISSSTLSERHLMFALADRRIPLRLYVFLQLVARNTRRRRGSSCGRSGSAPALTSSSPSGTDPMPSSSRSRSTSLHDTVPSSTPSLPPRPPLIRSKTSYHLRTPPTPTESTFSVLRRAGTMPLPVISVLPPPESDRCSPSVAVPPSSPSMPSSPPVNASLLAFAAQSRPFARALLIVFSLVSRESFRGVEERWLPWVLRWLSGPVPHFPYFMYRETCPALVLVGTKRDVRDAILKQHSEEFRCRVTSVAPSSPSRETPVSLLPLDVLGVVFSFLSMEDLARAACVCRLWRVVATDPYLWRDVAVRCEEGHALAHRIEQAVGREAQCLYYECDARSGEDVKDLWRGILISLTCHNHDERPSHSITMIPSSDVVRVLLDHYNPDLYRDPFDETLHPFVLQVARNVHCGPRPCFNFPYHETAGGRMVLYRDREASIAWVLSAGDGLGRRPGRLHRLWTTITGTGTF